MNQTIKEISQMLADRAEDVCAHLLPGGKRNGAEWESGSTGGEGGKSCKVRLTGGKAGIWADFATGSDSGDLLDLWASTNGIRLAEAIQEAKAWLGIVEPRYQPVLKSYSRPKVAIAPIANEAHRYLEKERFLTNQTLSDFKVGTSADGIIALPSYGPTGELLNVKHLSVKRDAEGKKIIRTEKDCAPSLFGWQAFKGGRVVAITEGEIDAMTIHQYGIPALSVPFGAGKGSKNDWIDFEWENLVQFETIYLIYDNDEAGQSCIEEVARRLGIYRCKSVKLLFKDANDCLQHGMSEEELQECLKSAKTFDPPEIRSPLEFRDKVQRYFYPTEDQENRSFAPRIFNFKIGFRPGELTIWTGCNSHGKSVMIGQMMIVAMVLHHRVAIASMEMKPEQTLGRMMKQFLANSKPEPADLDTALNWMAGRLWIYDLMGNVGTKKLMELIEFSVRRHSVSHFVIDSLMKCDVGGDDYDAQRKFLNDIVTFAKNHDCHIHLIAHPRKGDEEKPIGRFSISGSGDISNQADNIVSVWRNKAKERGEKVWTDSDTVVLCDKQRETGYEGYFDLDFSKPTEQFLKKGGEVTKFFEWAYKDTGVDPESPVAPPTARAPLPSHWTDGPTHHHDCPN